MKKGRYILLQEITKSCAKLFHIGLRLEGEEVGWAK